MSDELDDVSMLDLFRMEAESHLQAVTAALLELETHPTAADQLELCMRSAHSLKGAARIVDLKPIVRIAHVMEDCFVAAQHGRMSLTRAHIDALLGATDLLKRVADTPEAEQQQWADERTSGIAACLDSLVAFSSDASVAAPAPPPAPATTAVAAAAVPPAAAASTNREAADRVLRVNADSLNRLLGLAGESLVHARWIEPFAASLLKLKRLHHDTCLTLDALRDMLSGSGEGPAHAAVQHAYGTMLESQQLLSRRLGELEMFGRRSLNVSHRMYREALACRMRPFSDGTQAFPKMVRDVARTLGKEVVLEIVGDTTQVDRDILSKLDAPLGHLLRNAVDHGIESPDERRRTGKPARGTIRLEARHSSGALQVIISDDGSGVNLANTRAAVIERNLLNREAAEHLSDAELLEFLFLPGFSMKGSVTQISGRGVGLDVVRDMVTQVRGTVRITTDPGRGTRFLLQLPVTLSVVRALLAEIDGEPYAFPVVSVVRALKLPKDHIDVLEGRQHFDLDGQRFGLVSARQVLGLSDASTTSDEVSILVVGDHGSVYGFAVDRLLGERELVVQPLDPQLGKVKDIAAGAVLEDGSPILIVDPGDLVRSADRLVSDGQLTRVMDKTNTDISKRKRVLVVDDSLTVRELERKLLVTHGYDVEVAVDGMDGWNAVRMGNFDLVVTDIDMPRMDGIELVTLINADARLRLRPVIVVSYKDREEDRRRGLDATLVQAVVDLIGEAAA
jgi:two-component system sensor histidine kinase and response regulator WspE